MPSNGSTSSPSSRAALSVAGDVATHRIDEIPGGQRGKQEGNRGTGPQSDRHPVLHQLRSGLGGGSLLPFDVDSGGTAGNLRARPDSPQPVY